MIIRSLHPTDLAALILFRSKAPPNEAHPRDSFNQRDELPLGPLFKQWLPAKGKRRSLIYIHQGRLAGLVSARSRSSPSTWEIIYLAVGHNEPNIFADLLERLCFTLGALGAQRLFLRLGASSPVLEAAKRASFSPYLTEILYCFVDRKPMKPPPSHILRPKSQKDEYQLFQLYRATMPVSVASAEGMTLQEWQGSREQEAKRELVWENEGRLGAWLRIRENGRAGQFEIMAADGEESRLKYLTEHSLLLLNDKRPIFCLTPVFQEQLRQLLERQGFEPVEEYYCLVKPLVARLRQPQLAPLRA